jgi:hypothetical protein
MSLLFHGLFIRLECWASHLLKTNTMNPVLKSSNNHYTKKFNSLFSDNRRATSRTVPGSIPSCVTGFFSDISPSDHSMALGSTQPLVKMSTRDIPGGKGGRWVRLTTSPPSRAKCQEIWEPKPPGTLWATQGLLRDSFTFTFSVNGG